MNMSNSTGANETFEVRKELITVRAAITMYSVLLVWSLVANVLVIAVVYCNQNLRTNMNYLIVNMAVSDLLIPLVAMPYGISFYMTNGQWFVDGPLGVALCKLVPFFSDLSPFVSSIGLVTIAFQRYIAVVHPQRAQILSRKTRWVAISCPWIVAMSLYSPNFYIYRLTNIYGYTMCIYSWAPAFEHWTAEMIWKSTATVVGLVAPLVTTIIMYSIIIYKLRKSLNNVRDMMGKQTIVSRQRRNRRIFGMLMTIVVLFAICWCPLFVFGLMDHVAPSLLSMDAFMAMQNVFSYMWFLQAAINPCIYFVFLKDFRQGLKSICCASANEPLPRRPRTPGGDSNHDPTCTPPHIYITSV